MASAEIHLPGKSSARASATPSPRNRRGRARIASLLPGLSRHLYVPPDGDGSEAASYRHHAASENSAGHSTPSQGLAPPRRPDFHASSQCRLSATDIAAIASADFPQCGLAGEAGAPLDSDSPSAHASARGLVGLGSAATWSRRAVSFASTPVQAFHQTCEHRHVAGASPARVSSPRFGAFAASHSRHSSPQAANHDVLVHLAAERVLAPHSGAASTVGPARAAVAEKRIPRRPIRHSISAEQATADREVDQNKKSNDQAPRIPGQIACADLQTRAAMGVAAA